MCAAGRAIQQIRSLPPEELPAGSTFGESRHLLEHALVRDAPATSTATRLEGFDLLLETLHDQVNGLLEFNELLRE